MRPVVPTDLDHCVRAVMSVPGPEQAATMQTIIERADMADRFRKRTGRVLRGAGDGSLMTSAWTIARQPPHAFCDRSYCAALAVVIDALAHWRARPGTSPEPDQTYRVS